MVLHWLQVLTLGYPCCFSIFPTMQGFLYLEAFIAFAFAYVYMYSVRTR